MSRLVTAIVAMLIFATSSLRGETVDSCALPSYPSRWNIDAAYVALPLLTEALIMKENIDFRQNSFNGEIPRLKEQLIVRSTTRIDNFLQYSPLALSTALKAAGNPGRSNWSRYIACSAMSFALTYGIALPMKHTISENRPNGMNSHSFPSGHTALAFASATILHREYGLTTNIWYSVGAYSVATLTGLMRVINNRHWMWDVYAGAAIGILSTEVAYGIGDLIFKERGLRVNDKVPETSIIYRPSFISIGMGFEPSRSTLSFPVAADTDKATASKYFRLGRSAVIDFEGAYFPSTDWGLGGRLRMRCSQMQRFGQLFDILDGIYGTTDMQNAAAIKIGSDRLTDISASIGAYYNLPLGRYLAIGSKAILGYLISDGLRLEAIKGESCWDLLKIKGSNAITVGTGLSLTFCHKSYLACKIYADYDYDSRRYEMNLNPYVGLDATYAPIESSLQRRCHHFTLGSSFCFSF